jgi:hypothetical protein
MKQITITKTEYSELLSNHLILIKGAILYEIKALDEVHKCLLVEDNDFKKAKVVDIRWRGLTKYQI